MTFVEFQKRVLYLLADISDSVKKIGKKYEPVDSPFHVTRVETLEQLWELEDLLKDDETKRNSLVSYKFSC